MNSESWILDLSSRFCVGGFNSRLWISNRSQTATTTKNKTRGWGKRCMVDQAPWWSGRLGGESFLYRSKIDEASSQTLSKIVPKSVQNRPKIDQKSSQNRQNEGPGALLDHLWRISGPKVAPGSIFGRFWEGLGVHFGAIFRSNFGMFFDMFSDRFFDRFLIDSGPHFGRFFASKMGSV